MAYEVWLPAPLPYVMLSELNNICGNGSRRRPNEADRSWRALELGRTASNATPSSVFLTLTLHHWMLSYRILQPGGVSHGPDVPRMGNPLSSGGIQFESIIILPSLSILPWHRTYRFGTYPIYHIISYRRPDGGESYALDNARRRFNWP